MRTRNRCEGNARKHTHAQTQTLAKRFQHPYKDFVGLVAQPRSITNAAAGDGGIGRECICVCECVTCEQGQVRYKRNIRDVTRAFSLSVASRSRDVPHAHMSTHTHTHNACMWRSFFLFFSECCECVRTTKQAGEKEKKKKAPCKGTTKTRTHL